MSFSRDSVRVVYSESNEIEGRKVCYMRLANRVSLLKQEVVTSGDHSNKKSGILTKIETFARNAFLPEGYPDSVSQDYLAYQIWDTVQAFASSIAGSLATQAVLEGVGVGDETATPLAATITWLMRHGAGMAGQIAFTWMQGSDLDHNCKRWRLFADVLNDTAMCLELSGPMWPQGTCLQLVLCTAGVARALVGVAGGATRTAITQHQARKDNISDVAAKDGSQETLVNLAALLLNLSILPLLSGDSTLTWLLFALLTGLHLFANYQAVKSLVFDTLNKDRLITVMQSFTAQNGHIPSPREANAKESVILGMGADEKLFCGAAIHPGVSLSHCPSYVTDNNLTLRQLADELSEKRFAIVPSGDNRDMNILLAKHYQSKDLLEAYSRAFVQAYRQPMTTTETFDFVDFQTRLKHAGWKTSHVLMSTCGWKGTFDK